MGIKCVDSDDFQNIEYIDTVQIKEIYLKNNTMCICFSVGNFLNKILTTHEAIYDN
jgi:hypothetical protein